MTASEAGPPVPEPTTPAVADLLGLLAYGELSAFDRLAADSRMAPTLAGRAAIAEMAAAEIGHYRQLRDRLHVLGVDPESAMRPFAAALDAFHDSTRPSTWLEGLVKAYVGDGLAADFYREIAGCLDEPTRQLVLEVLSDTGHAAFAVREVRAAIAADPTLAGRLALWARRLLGEAISRAQHVAAERDTLAELLLTGSGQADGLAGIGALFRRLTDRHAQRMRSLGLSS